MHDTLTAPIAESGAMVRTDGHCLNAYMLINGSVQIGDNIPCEAGCGGAHEIRELLHRAPADVGEMPTRPAAGGHRTTRRRAALLAQA